MFLKRCMRRKQGKRHMYWELVESYRTPKGSRHRVVAYLGEVSRSEKQGWARLGRLLDGQAAEKAEQLRLFDRAWPTDEERVPEKIEVRLKGLAVGRMRDFGEVYLALLLWRTLGLDDLLEAHVEAGGKETVPWTGRHSGAARVINDSPGSTPAKASKYRSFDACDNCARR